MVSRDGIGHGNNTEHRYWNERLRLIRSRDLDKLNKANHRILVEGDTALHNQYGVIAINTDKHPRVNARDAQTFVD